MARRFVLRNQSDYLDVELRELVRFAAADVELPSRYSTVVRVSHSRRGNLTGQATDYVRVRRDVPAEAAYEILLRIPKPECFPTPAWETRGRVEPIPPLEDWREAVVALAAHEWKHVEDFQRDPSWQKTTTGPERETRCDAYAAARLHAYRAVKL